MGRSLVWVLPFAHPEGTVAWVVGGKGCQLAMLTQMGAQVRLRYKGIKGQRKRTKGTKDSSMGVGRSLVWVLPFAHPTGTVSMACRIKGML